MSASSRRALGAIGARRDASPDAFGKRQLGMGGLHPAEATRNLGREGRRLLGLHIHVQRHVLRGCRNPAFGGVKELLEIVYALGIIIEQLEGHAHRIVGVKFAQVTQVYLGGETGVPAFLHIVGAEPISSKASSTARSNTT